MDLPRRGRLVFQANSYAVFQVGRTATEHYYCFWPIWIRRAGRPAHADSVMLFLVIVHEWKDNVFLLNLGKATRSFRISSFPSSHAVLAHHAHPCPLPLAATQHMEHLLPCQVLRRMTDRLVAWRTSRYRRQLRRRRCSGAGPVGDVPGAVVPRAELVVLLAKRQPLLSLV